LVLVDALREDFVEMGCSYNNGSTDERKYMCGTTQSKEDLLEVERFLDPS
jgi:hypothetical protein